MIAEGRATIVVVTHNRRAQLLSTLQYLQQLPGQWPIIAIDNGSSDNTANAVAARFPSIMLIRSRRNLGAAARNIGVAYVNTPYVAFSDDDTQWDAGSLERAVCMLDMAPKLAVATACVQVGATRQPDPTCTAMAQSPLDRADLPGPRLLSFMAGACVMRTRAFMAVEGYWPPFFIGGEDELMALDLVDRGWQIVYAVDVIVRHFPSSIGDSRLRDRMLIRNAIWTAWMRRPLASAWRVSCVRLREAYAKGIYWSTFMDTLLGLPRALGRRRVISPAVEKMRRLLDVPAQPANRRGTPKYKYR